MDEERQQKQDSAEYKLYWSYCWTFTGFEVSSKREHENKLSTPPPHPPNTLIQIPRLFAHAIQ